MGFETGNYEDKRQMALSRRGFLKGAASMGVAAAAGAAFVGCAQPTGKDKDVSPAPDKDEALQAYEADALPIDPVNPPSSWDDEVDVVVVGSGGGGMAASIRLAMAGYQVVMFEKDTETGGASRYSGHFVNFGGHKMAEEVQWAYPSYPYDPDAIVEYLNDVWQQG